MDTAIASGGHGEHGSGALSGEEQLERAQSPAGHALHCDR